MFAVQQSLYCSDHSEHSLRSAVLQSGAVEVIDLTEQQQEQLWRETAAVSAVIQKLPGVKKLNVAAIGDAAF